METYSLKSIQCSKCSQKTLIETNSTAPCSFCGSKLISRPRPPRYQSEKKAPKPIAKTHQEPLKPRQKEEEKKKTLKKPKPDKKPSKDLRPSLKPKTKDLAPQAKKSKKKKLVKKRRNSPEDPAFVDFFSDDLRNEGYFSDSFEGFSLETPVFGFNPVYISHRSVFQEHFDRGLLNRVSQNLFNLFFDGFAEIEYMPHLSAFQSDSEIFSIGNLLRNLVTLHPEQTSPTDPEVIQRIPMVRVTESVKRLCPSCTICQEELKTGERVKKLRCSHFYHDLCIEPWLSAKNTCPVCREVVC
jgi:DNA-directed RNA polymerase subunit RPC12/RpoP